VKSWKHIWEECDQQVVLRQTLHTQNDMTWAVQVTTAPFIHTQSYTARFKDTFKLNAVWPCFNGL
jgi:hypothetical protein